MHTHSSSRARKAGAYRTPSANPAKTGVQEKPGKATASSIDEALLASIFSALTVLGDSVRDSILSFEKSKYSIEPDEIPRKVDGFMKGLRDLLGYGGGVVEKLAIKSFAEKFQLTSSQVGGRSLGDLANLVRQSSLQH